MIDNKKISELYDSLARELLIFIFSFVKSQEISEDILHETFIRLLTHAKNDSINDKNLRALLYTISRNLCIDYIRKKKREHVMPLDENIKAPDREAADAFEAVELKTKIEDTLGKCDPVSRSIFIMKRELELTYDEIAIRMNISKRTAIRKMQKISAVLAEELKKYDFGG